MWYILKILRHHVICFESALTSCDMLSRVGAVCAILVSLNNSTALRGIQNSSLWKIASLSWNYKFHDKMCRKCECCHSLILSCHCHQCQCFFICHGLSPVHIATKSLSLILMKSCVTPGKVLWLLVSIIWLPSIHYCLITLVWLYYNLSLRM